MNLTRGDALCVGAMADRPLSRMVGLMGRRALPPGEGLLLSPAPGIHTAFMRFPIDALFLDRDLRVVDIIEELGPWRMASRRHARSVLELAAGECARHGVRVGDRLGLHERHLAPETSHAGAADAVPGTRREAVASPGIESVIWPDSVHAAAGGQRPSALRVLVISRDRHFRSVTSMLLAHRGCSVTTTAKGSQVEEMIIREQADVVVIDTADSRSRAGPVASVRQLSERVGLVVVDEIPDPPREPSVIAKWGPFEDLFAAIESAARSRDASLP